VQLVEIPGLIEGAREDRGGGRALLGVLRGADAMVLCHPAGDPLVQLHTLRAELEEGGIDLPTIVAITKSDEARPGATEQLARKLGDLEVVAVSILDDPSLDRFRDAVWRLTGLIRIFLRRSGEDDGNSLALRPPVSVLQVAHSIHHEVGEACRGARLWGPSARFQGQRVGRDHVLADGDRVEILT
jgi:ribosome-interacting GTPase 1